MYTTFLAHQWMGFWRSKGKGGTIATQLIMGFIVLYLAAVSIFIGYNMEHIIEEMLPGKDVMLVFNGMILYYFTLEFLMRLQLQELPTLAVQPYLHLNIPKRKLISFLNITALFSVFNLLPLLLFFPFAILKINNDFGPFACIMYLLAISSLVVFNNYAALYFKRLTIGNLKAGILGSIFLVAVGLLEYFKVFSIASLSNHVFHEITITPLIAIIFPIAAVIMLTINTRFLKGNLYLEELQSAKQKKSSTDYPFLDRFGETGVYLALEIKLILRNKRSRSTLTKGLLFIFYGLLFYKQETLDANKFWSLIFPATFMTGNMIMLYGQFMFGWQSAEFDGLITSKLNIKTFFKAKFLLFTIGSSLLTAAVSLYGLISWKILILQFAVYFYNIGVTSVITLYFATKNYKALDLSKGSAMNWQGITASTMLQTIPLMLSPYLIYLPISLISNPYWGIAGVAITGLAGLSTRNFWINFLTKEFQERKYKIAEGFRQK
ncbi:hypothetical protein HDE69_003570 [Pedobacter cryoconitis]|uniref:ABC-2 type transport system permease protein n=1 Tax=Pedobacter cryoconitis TaxID=188932 RepID=A0A7W9DLT4_9SPHI|nr:DUF5687 family protein [Pedobacter cryoconitis]MBB5622495.1 hypothetical protein [Pedobacter cryoconitis]